MIELFVLSKSLEAFKYYLPDGRVIGRGPNGALNLSPLMEFIEEEIKIVYLPTEEIFNHSTGEVEIEMFDDVHEAISKSAYFTSLNI